MIVDFSPEYRYIFNPNVIKVTCENITNPTKEVTLTGNGITLKRNCIASICYFDLAVIFESYFAGSEFKIDYSTLVDPFYNECSLTITATDETTITDEPFSLRWGAKQFDDTDTVVDYTFPFWPGMDFSVNSDLKYDSTFIFGSSVSDGTYTDIKLIPINSTTEFIAQRSLLSIDIQTVTYKPETCPTDGRYLRWVDSTGKVIHFMFYSNKENLYSKEIKTALQVPVYPMTIIDTVGGRLKTIRKESQRTLTAFQSVDVDIYPYVESIVSSPIVALYKNSQWIGVNISDMTVTPQNAYLIDIEFTIELPKDFTQTR